MAAKIHGAQRIDTNQLLNIYIKIPHFANAVAVKKNHGGTVVPVFMGSVKEHSIFIEFFQKIKLHIRKQYL